MNCIPCKTINWVLAACLLTAACSGEILPNAADNQKPGSPATQPGRPDPMSSPAAKPGPAGSGAEPGGSVSGVPPAAIGVMRGVIGLPLPSRCVAAALNPGPTPLRRLTRREFDRTVADLLGDNTAPSTTFPAEEHANGFDNNADLAQASVLLVEQYELVAERLARQAAQDLPKLMGCTPSNPATEDACAQQFLGAFGQRAFRRPLARDESDRHLAFYTTNKGKYGFPTAVRLMLQTLLQSPAFLYRVEDSGTTTAASAMVVKANPWDLASRLSYLIWGSMPDKLLLDAAATGGLASAADVTREGRRMLDDPKAKVGLRNFFSQWLELANVDTLTKDDKIFKSWNQRIAGLMRRESETFIDESILKGNGGLLALLRADHSYADKELATYYGLRGPMGSAFEKVQMDVTQRSGVLTQGALLASLAGPVQSSPVKRGYFLRDRLLCAPPPPAPANLNTKIPAPDGKSSTRERFAAHRADPACAGCHALMDPLGLGLENFDGVGLWRARDAERVIDASGEIKGTRDADGPFVGAVDLATKLSASVQVRECLARQYFRFAFARADQDGDACAVEALAGTLAGAGTVRGLLLGLTQTDAFLMRTVEAGGGI